MSKNNKESAELEEDDAPISYDYHLGTQNHISIYSQAKEPLRDLTYEITGRRILRDQRKAKHRAARKAAREANKTKG